MNLSALSDDALISSLCALEAESRRVVARIVMYLAEVEARSLHLTQACSSMFDFCTRRLGMSEGAAHRRINAARLVRRFPQLLDHLQRGELHLSTLVLLAKHLTESSFDEIMAGTLGKSLRDVDSFLARYAPRPDVPDRISQLPAAVPPSITLEGLQVAAARAVIGAASRQRIEPLSEARHLVQLTASTELREKLERARDLMRHRNPTGDLAVIVEKAVDLLVAQLEKERLGKSSRAHRSAHVPKRGTITRAVRREVFERDGEQCTFCDEKGQRCPSKTLLELDHIDSRATGGADDASNLRVRCRAHNRLHAERIFGKLHVARSIDVRRRTSLSRKAESRRERADAKDDAFDVALRGLMNLGFAKAEAIRALDDVSADRTDEQTPPTPADLLRASLAVLT